MPQHELVWRALQPGSRILGHQDEYQEPRRQELRQAEIVIVLALEWIGDVIAVAGGGADALDLEVSPQENRVERSTPEPAESPSIDDEAAANLAFADEDFT